MRSKRSCFNNTLFRKNLGRFWPLWGGASLVGSLLPLAMLMQMMNGRQGLEPLETTRMYYAVLTDVVPVLSLLYAVLCAMLVWSYLYSARSVGLMHALPIRREGLFLTNFLSGMAMMIIPYGVTGLLCVLVTAAFGGFEPVGVAVTVLGVLGMSFFYFASATLAAFITGNLFALPALYALLHFLAWILEELITLLASGFIFGLSGEYVGAAEWLSPTAYLTRRLWVETAYREVERVDAFSGQPYTDSVLTSVSLEGGWLIAVYALAGAALLVLAYALYRRRRSECAGDVVAAAWMRPIFQFGAAALAALTGGQVLYGMFWSGIQQGSACDAVPMAVCMALAGIVGLYVAAMLLQKSLRVFRGSWPKALAVVAAAAAVCCALHFDPADVAGRVPAAEDLSALELRAAGNSYTLDPETDGDLVEQVRRLHQTVVAEEARIRETDREYSRQAREGDIPEDVTYEYLRLTYDLAGGGAVTRYYSLPVSRDLLDREGTFDQCYDALLNSTAMRLKRLKADEPGYTIYGAWVSSEVTGGVDLSMGQTQALMDAVVRDAENGTWGRYDWFGDDRDAYAVGISVEFLVEDREDPEETYRDYIDITLRPEMTETVAYLLDVGALTEEDLLTNLEVYPNRYETQAYEDTEAVAAVYADG